MGKNDHGTKEKLTMISYKKISSKLENYWISDSFFREKMYLSLRKSNFLVKERICLKFKETSNVILNYSDLNLTPNEISVFFSGLFFDTPSTFITIKDYDKPRLVFKEYEEINNYFFAVGKKIGQSQELTYLLYLASKNKDPLYISRQFEAKFNDSCYHATYFNKGLSGETLDLWNYNNKIFYQTGIDAKNKNIISALQQASIFSNLD